MCGQHLNRGLMAWACQIWIHQELKENETRRWLQQAREEGNCLPKPKQGRGSCPLPLFLCWLEPLGVCQQLLLWFCLGHIPSLPASREIILIDLIWSREKAVQTKSGYLCHWLSLHAAVLSLIQTRHAPEHTCIALHSMSSLLHFMQHFFFQVQLLCGVLIVTSRLLFLCSVWKEMESCWELADLLEIRETFFLSQTNPVPCRTAINAYYKQQVYGRKIHILYILKHLYLWVFYI